jgi:dipeptidyl aminopeptidase/acylaminoacyl peptidase
MFPVGGIKGGIRMIKNALIIRLSGLRAEGGYFKMSSSKVMTNLLLAIVMLALIVQPALAVDNGNFPGQTVSVEGNTQADHPLWTVNDTMRVAQIESIDISPDGNKVAYAVKRAVMTEEESKWWYQIYVVDSDGNNTFQLTQGEASFYHPKWSPDGQFIAFLSDLSGKSDIWMIPVSGGEAVQLTDVKTGVADFRWSPNGEMIIFLAPDLVSYEMVRAIAAKDDFKVVDQDIYVTGQEIIMNHLWVVTTQKNSTGSYEARRVTGGNFSVSQWDWSPDSEAAVFSHTPGPGAEDILQSDISKVDLKTGEVTSLVKTEATETSPIYSPDGRWIAFCSRVPSAIYDQNVFIIPSQGGQKRPLAETPNQMPMLIGWSNDSQYIYLWEYAGTTDVVLALPVDGSAPKAISEKGGVMAVVYLNRAMNTLGFTLENSSEPVEVYTSRIDEFEPVKVSNLNEDLPVELLGRTEVISWNSSDGMKVEGLLTYPVNYEPGKRYPLLLMIHGGPQSVFSQEFIGGSTIYPLSYIYPYAAFSSQGYAVLRVNPRGSGGYGAEFRKKNIRDWGGMDYQDLMTGVDKVIEMGLADTERQGVMGWSYGGFMTAWIITQPDRFKAASVGAALINAISYDGTSDIHWLLPDYLGANFWDDYNVYMTHSPIYYVRNVTTPTLIQHGEEDIRVPLTQGEELYSALKKRGVPVKMVVYPRSGHEPEEPRLLRAIMNHNLEWFNKYVSINE